MKYILTVLIIATSLLAFTQELNNKELLKFKKGEKALLEYMYMFAYDTIPFETRVKNIHDFIPRFVGLLKEKNSYLYPFDSLRYLSKITAPDNAFKIFTWELKEPLGTYRYYGAIQINSKELKILPLFDYSDTMVFQPQRVLNNKDWYGCLYYNCTLTENEKGKKIYTLFGLDRQDFVSNQKIIEILTFNDNKLIEFGAEPLLKTIDTLGNLIKEQNRLFLEYNEKSRVHLNFNELKQEIVYDHITPPSKKEKDASFTYIPDGTYEGFKWNKNYWKSVYRVFTYSINKPDSPPMPVPQNSGKRKNMLGQ